MSMERLDHPYLLSEITRLEVEGKTFGKRIADLERDMIELQARLWRHPMMQNPSTGLWEPLLPGEPGPDEAPSSPGDARPGELPEV